MICGGAFRAEGPLSVRVSVTLCARQKKFAAGSARRWGEGSRIGDEHSSLTRSGLARFRAETDWQNNRRAGLSHREKTSQRRACEVHRATVQQVAYLTVCV
jgi:hypothetical protein